MTVFEFMDELKADSVLQEKAKSLSNVEIFVSSQTVEVIGDGDKLTALRIKDRKTEEERLVELDGVFVQIGLAANSASFNSSINSKTVTFEQIPARSIAASIPEFPPPTTATCFPL